MKTIKENGKTTVLIGPGDPKTVKGIAFHLDGTDFNAIDEVDEFKANEALKVNGIISEDGMLYRVDLDTGKKHTLMAVPPTRTGEIVIPDGVVDIDIEAFYRSKAEKIVIPGSVKSISFGCFITCWYLKEVVLNEGLESICAEAFEHCHELETVTIPGSVVNIGAKAFADAPLRNLKFADSDKALKICSGAFEKCSAENIDIPNRNFDFGTSSSSIFFNVKSVTLEDSKEGLLRLPDVLSAFMSDWFVVDGALKVHIGDDTFFFPKALKSRNYTKLVYETQKIVKNRFLSMTAEKYMIMSLSIDMCKYAVHDEYYETMLGVYFGLSERDKIGLNEQYMMEVIDRRAILAN